MRESADELTRAHPHPHRANALPLAMPASRSLLARARAAGLRSASPRCASAHSASASLHDRTARARRRWHRPDRALPRALGLRARGYPGRHAAQRPVTRCPRSRRKVEHIHADRVLRRGGRARACKAARSTPAVVQLRTPARGARALRRPRPSASSASAAACRSIAAGCAPRTSSPPGLAGADRRGRTPRSRARPSCRKGHQDPPSPRKRSSSTTRARRSSATRTVYGPRQLVPREWCIVRRILDGMLLPSCCPRAGSRSHTFGYAENLAHAVLLAGRPARRVGGSGVQLRRRAGADASPGGRATVTACMGASLEILSPSRPSWRSQPPRCSPTRPTAPPRARPDQAAARARLPRRGGAGRSPAPHRGLAAGEPARAGRPHRPILGDTFDYAAEDQLAGIAREALARGRAVHYWARPGPGCSPTCRPPTGRSAERGGVARRPAARPAAPAAPRPRPSNAPDARLRQERHLEHAEKSPGRHGPPARAAVAG